jgi:hypothetical protein
MATLQQMHNSDCSMGCFCLQDKRAVPDPVAVKRQDEMGEAVEPHPAG